MFTAVDAAWLRRPCLHPARWTSSFPHSTTAAVRTMSKGDRGTASEHNDARVERSVAAIRVAMADLLHEQRFDEITVQRILERAGVARATFYAHYRNKDDALYASFEGMIRHLESQMDLPGRDRGRLVPVTELLEHFGGAGAVFTSLKDAGRLEGIWGLGTDFIAEMIARRVSASGGSAADGLRLPSRMLAAACVEMLRWWTEHPQPPEPAWLDAQFHAMARRVLQAP